MTMGPAPMIRTVWISVRLGMLISVCRTFRSGGLARKPATLLRAFWGRPSCRLRGPFRWVGAVPQPLNRRVSSAFPAQGPFLHRIDEVPAIFDRFRPGFFDAVVPDGRLIAVLDQHQIGIELQALAL